MNDRDFYEAFWQSHQGDVERQLAIHSESRRPLLKLLERCLPADQPARFLEVGCGTAIDSCLLLERLQKSAGVAVDLSIEATRVAHAYASRLRRPLYLGVADLTQLPFPESHFDLVFSQGVLEHFEDPMPGMREQIRVLRPGGVLVVDVPQKFNLYTLHKKRAMRAGDWPWGWETEYSLSELRSWAGLLGLEVVRATGHEHGRILDRLVIHPHRMLRNKLARWMGNGHARPYHPSAISQSWEGLWDWIDEKLGPHLAVNVAVAFRKPGLTSKVGDPAAFRPTGAPIG